MSEWLHRVFSGNPITPRQLRIAGYVAIIWFMMDTVEWIDWLIGKLH